MQGGVEGTNDDGVVEWTVTGKDDDTLRILPRSSTTTPCTTSGST